MGTEDRYDVVILGGGLAGLTLALQLTGERAETSILILERRQGDAPEAAHKVGESTVELGTHYLREVLGLRDYLDAHQLPKHGLRFFFTPQHKDDVTKRVELGPRERLPAPSHQIDRGIFENELVSRVRERGVEVALGARVLRADLDGAGHRVRFEREGEELEVSAGWVVDASGRAGLLKRQLGFQATMDHAVNAVWFRLNCEIDIDDWSEDRAWRNQLEPGLRRLGTIHLMDRGYWVWLIPLVSGSTSVGIVADPEVHDFESINRFERAMSWLRVHEPQAHGHLSARSGELMDFKVLKHFAHGSGEFYSRNRWGVTGESGAFLDPFYSPGTDFIALANTWLTDLITRDLAGERIALRASLYEQMHSTMIDNWLSIYQNKYPLFGNTQLMVTKIFWDWAIYWGVTTLLFTNRGFTNLDLVRQVFVNADSVLQRMGRLNARMQQMFLDFAPHDQDTFTHRYLDPLALGFLRRFHEGIEIQHEPAALLARLDENLHIIEAVAAELYRRISRKVHGVAPPEPVDPYAIELDPRDTAPGQTGIAVDPAIARDVDELWFYDSGASERP